MMKAIEILIEQNQMLSDANSDLRRQLRLADVRIEVLSQAGCKQAVASEGKELTDAEIEESFAKWWHDEGHAISNGASRETIFSAWLSGYDEGKGNP